MNWTEHHTPDAWPHITSHTLGDEPELWDKKVGTQGGVQGGDGRAGTFINCA